MSTIAENIAKVRERIREAAQASQRDSQSVGLLAVSKTKPAAAVREAYAAGQRDFGENYLQEALAKQAELGDLDLVWHFIGPIQSNKTKLIAEHFHWVHSVDRLKIAQRLSEQRPAHLPALQVCIQVNADGGDTKSGCTPAEAPALAQAIAQLPRLQLRGVMSIPDPQPDAAAMLAVHQQVVAVFHQLQQLPGLAALDTISLGMTADLASAIAAGSTMVRVGSGIFGARS